MAAASMRMEPRKSSRFSSAACLQLGDEFLDVVGHVVEGFGQFADFRRALHRRALVKFSAADGPRGGGQCANRRADADGKQISEDQRRESNDHHEFQRLGVQFRYAGVFTRIVQSTLSDHGPAQVRNGAVGSHHLRFVLPLSVIRKRRRVSVVRRPLGSAVAWVTTGELGRASEPGTNWRMSGCATMWPL